MLFVGGDDGCVVGVYGLHVSVAVVDEVGVVERATQEGPSVDIDVHNPR